MPSSFLRLFRPRASSDTTNDIDHNDATECYACTQVGVPVFHSISCPHAQIKLQWEASAGSSLVPIHTRPGSKIIPNRSSKSQSLGPYRRLNFFNRVYDPRSKRVQKWNRLFLLARGVALAVDPLFFYTLSIGRGGAPCLYMDGALAAVVAVIRTLVDVIHVVHMWLMFRMAYVSRESLVVGCGKLVWDPQAIASHYLRSVKGFWYDAFVILPVPQVTNMQLFVLACYEIINITRAGFTGRNDWVEFGEQLSFMWC